jgi:hypothetical protein
MNRPSEIEALLASNDDSLGWECPRNFDRSQAVQQFRKFLSALEDETGLRFEFETESSIQDASFHSEIRMQTGWLRFSNFGRMIAFTPDYEAPSDVVATIHRLAPGHGYSIIPTDALETDYTSKRDGSEKIDSWWIRFFDYL